MCPYRDKSDTIETKWMSTCSNYMNFDIVMLKNGITAMEQTTNGTIKRAHNRQLMTITNEL